MEQEDSNQGAQGVVSGLLLSNAQKTRYWREVTLQQRGPDAVLAWRQANAGRERARRVTEKKVFETLNPVEQELIRKKKREARQHQRKLKKQEEAAARMSALGKTPPVSPGDELLHEVFSDAKGNFVPNKDIANSKESAAIERSLQYKLAKVIMPPSAGADIEALVHLKRFDSFMHTYEKSIQEKLQIIASVDQDAVTGIRTINMGRYEVFLNAHFKGCGMINYIIAMSERYHLWVAENPEHEETIPLSELEQLHHVVGEESVQQIRESIVDFASARAKLDPRCCTGYRFQNHAMIISFGSVEKQVCHIDIGNPLHFQAGLVCTNGVHGTSEYEPGVTDLGQVWPFVPDGLQEKLKNIEETRVLLLQYGGLLSPEYRLVNKDTSKNLLPIGSTITMPGGVIHCGPASVGIRAILFFTATPVNDEEHYNPDNQYTRSTLIAEFLVHAWTTLDVEERTYLLWVWWQLGLSLDPDSIDNLRHVNLKQIGDRLLLLKSCSDELIDYLFHIVTADRLWENTDNWDHPELTKFKLPTLPTAKTKIPKFENNLGNKPHACKAVPARKRLPTTKKKKTNK